LVGGAGGGSYKTAFWAAGVWTSPHRPCRWCDCHFQGLLYRLGSRSGVAGARSQIWLLGAEGAPKGP
jgi:hypothetical protein